MKAYFGGIGDEARVFVPLRDALEYVEYGVSCAVDCLLDLIQGGLHHNVRDGQ